MKKVKIRGIDIHYSSNFESFVCGIMNIKAQLIALNFQKITLHRDDLLRLNNNFLAYPDGTYITHLIKRATGAKVSKVAGCELWLSIASILPKDTKICLIGGKQSVIETVEKRFQNEFPQLQVVYSASGYFSESGEHKVIDDIAIAMPDIIFCAMGTPKQEIFLDKLIERHACMALGLGGSFDIFSEETQRAPLFLQRLSLEWLYRLVKEPHRIPKIVGKFLGLLIIVMRQRF